LSRVFTTSPRSRRSSASYTASLGRPTTSAKGIGSIDVAEQGATLEIFSADAQCITGAITKLTDVFPDAPDHNGAFFALPCAK
jgi:hypothetical protein